MPQHWAIWFAIDGDLRFLSHHDTMRCMERTALRARLPLRFSQGFNPRPAVALPCPRPVGVASNSDLAVMAMADDAPQLEEPGIVGSLNAAAPRGMHFTKAKLIERRTVHPRRIECELPLEAVVARTSRPRVPGASRPRIEENEVRGQDALATRGRDARATSEELPPESRPLLSLGARIAELSAKDSWIITRHSGDEKPDQEIDLRPMVKDLRVEDRRLRWTLVPKGQAWARPGEVLALLGLDAQVELARVVRTAVEYE